MQNGAECTHSSCARMHSPTRISYRDASCFSEQSPVQIQREKGNTTISRSKRALTPHFMRNTCVCTQIRQQIDGVPYLIRLQIKETFFFHHLL